MKQKWQGYKEVAKSMAETVLVSVTIFLGLLVVVYCLDGLNKKAKGIKNREPTILEKYEWLKDTAHQLKGKLNFIASCGKQMEKIEEFYENKNLAFAYAKWDYGDRERYCKLQRDKYWMEESYTSLAAEYNREMARSNWRFATVGGLPKGTDEPLPREFNLYAYNTQ